MPASFVHLRVHSAYSLAESTLHIAKIAELARDDLQPAVAITDTNNMFGALEFSQVMMGKGIQPIIGLHCNLQDERGIGEVALLARDDAGYSALCRLNSAALLGVESGAEPVIAMDSLVEHGAGLIVLGGGAVSGFLGNAAAMGQVDLLARRIDALEGGLGGRVYVEIQRHGLECERRAEPHLLNAAAKAGVPIVATNDCRFETRDMEMPHDVLVCIGASRVMADDARPRLSANHYFRPASEMVEMFADLPEAVRNTIAIARRCSVVSEARDPILPNFPTGEGRDETEELRHQTRQGLEFRLERYVFAGEMDDAEKERVAAPYRQRLEMELGIIIQMEFAGYFLIVADFIKWAKGRNIPVGPGRGSGAGSLVAWSLLITDLDPLRWGLLFERFLNPERVSMPDFDIDFCQDRRDEVITYVQEKYGSDRVAQIITFGTLQARAAIRDVGRVLGMPYSQVDRIAKLIPNNPANPVSIEGAMEGEEELRREHSQDERVREMIDISCKIEGLYRHASTHAAGLVIGDRPLDELVPLYLDPRSAMPVTQFSMKWVEKAGLVKFDFLGLKTLTVLQRAVGFIEARGGTIDLDTIPLDDKRTYDMLSAADTVGVFQLESSGMRDVLKGLRPDRFEDIIAVVALYRPGPMENIPQYVARKHDADLVTYMHPKLEPILNETYGIMIYQEQVQQAARDLAGYTLGGADLLRRAMGKKIQAEMDQQRETFIKGAAANEINEGLASEIFESISAFAGYGFNKSHAAAYALVAYQTAYLKANHPEEFLAASMSLETGNTDKLGVFRQECQRLSIEVLPPDVNASRASFFVEQPKNGGRAGVRYALGAIKNVGEEAMGLLVGERERGGPFKDLGDFLGRIPREACNRRQMEQLVRAGALDCLCANRRQMIENIDTIMGHAETVWRDKHSSQNSLFAGGNELDSTVHMKAFEDWNAADRLREEFASLGLYLSAHPLDSYVGKMERLRVMESDEFNRRIEAGERMQRVNFAGSITAKRELVSKRGSKYAFVQVTDKSGTTEITFFSELLERTRELMEGDSPVFVETNLKFEDNGLRLTAASIQVLDDAIAQWSGGVGLMVEDDKSLARIKSVLDEDGEGRSEVKLLFAVEELDVAVRVPGGYRLSGQARQLLRNLPGIGGMSDL